MVKVNVSRTQFSLSIAISVVLLHNLRKLKFSQRSPRISESFEYVGPEHMPGCHGGKMRCLSSMLANESMVLSQPGTDNFVLPVCCCEWFLVSLCYQEYSYIGVVTV